MATLNTLRTKYGIVLSIVIAIVLLAFILGDQLSYRGGNQEIVDETVAIVDGKQIKQSEYYRVREAYDQFQQFTPDVVADMSMQKIIYDNYLAPTLKQVGINVVQGEIDNYARSFAADLAMQYRNYGWPEEQIAALVQNQWVAESLSAESSIAATKFSDLYAAGFYANRLDVEQQLRNENLTFDGRYVAVPYSTIADTDIEVSDDEIKAYAEAHRVDNPRYGSRTVRYVRFDIEASEADAQAIEESINTLHNTVLAAADNDAIKSAVRAAGGKVGAYKAVETLGDEKTALSAGKHYGPVKENNVWKASYYLDGVKAPASYDFAIAEVESMEKAALIAEELRANDGDGSKLSEPIDFEEGSVQLAQLTENQAKNFIGRAEGEIFAFSNNGVPSVVKINKLGEKADYVLTADIEKAVVAGEKTIREITSKVDSFESKIGGSAESFQQAADESGYTLAHVTVNRNDYRPNPYYQVQRMAGNIPNSRSMAVWAYDAHVGDSKRFNIDGTVYVAMVIAVDDQKYTTNEPAARRALVAEKKYAKIAESLSMDAADAVLFEGVKAADQTIGDVRDARLIAAIAATRAEAQPTKVKGADAAYIFVVDKINGVEELPSIDEERIPINTQLMSSAEGAAMNILVSKAEIEDMRGESSL